MKILLALLPALALAACGEASAAPEPDPAEVARLVAELERRSDASLAEKNREKLETAERVVTTIDRANPERVATVAERFLAR